MIEVDIRKRINAYGGNTYVEVKTTFISKSVTKIFGPSGVGKTTFLKILAGLIQPEEGYIQVDQETWLDTKNKVNLPPQRRQVSLVFQDYALFPNMTVEQHLKYGTKDAAYIDRLLTIGKMESFIKHRPRQLSGGQQQRLGILRALATKPKLLLMDEPFSALDTALKTDLIPELKKLLAELGTTCLIVTHHPFETDDFAAHSFEFR